MEWFPAKSALLLDFCFCLPGKPCLVCICSLWHTRHLILLCCKSFQQLIQGCWCSSLFINQSTQIAQALFMQTLVKKKNESSQILLSVFFVKDSENTLKLYDIDFAPGMDKEMLMCSIKLHNSFPANTLCYHPTKTVKGVNSNQNIYYTCISLFLHYCCVSSAVLSKFQFM